ncbi:MAG TPA: phosphodiesterase [Cyanobacteria bacterium UBA11149]|nr:phosphodiesterase [Cyanobacteria bacterium UBA11367]HBE56915.1 phosphodiesterase [Cyanobacteria bacterium UBA11366]HBK66152.1 phosphodiesterase [Cyanobacteria bacterium UBA11166]HBR77171.1 phosphodiesterase [Cyanobacteria bacterium UBA11159]HBS70090.1 phosphodiesterase [Cyanobacteria bacterium UBA11153]HBW92211.1 phosphodiesterase [Cyanobacteria bacterium UBA11149]
MINTQSLEAVASTRLDSHIGKPLYDSYSFAQIPQTIYHLLTGAGKMGLPSSVLGDLPDKYDKIILLFVDAFGWRFFQQYLEDLQFLKRFQREGVASQITTQFPSTTAAHVATIHSGLPVGETGIYEWYYYEPLLDNIISPLLFSFAGDRERDTLKKTGVSEESLFPTQTIYHQLQDSGIESYCFQHQAYAFSPFSRVACNGAKVVPYKTVPEALVNLTEALLAQREKAYFFIYFDSIDAIAHKYSPNSPQFDAEVRTFWLTIERLLHESLVGKIKNTLLLITADHGQIEVSPQTTIYLNRLYPKIEKFMKTNRDGNPLVPAGSARDMFLYIKEEYLDEAYDLLSCKLQDRAKVYPTQTLIDEGYFGGGKPSSALLNRLGNLIILPHKHETVWWYEENRFEQKLLGHHGGLSREEMETIFLALPYS